MNLRPINILVLALILIAAGPFWIQEGLSDDSVDQSVLKLLPVREVTVFKDGHAFVLHEGGLPTDEAGDVRMDYLPVPVLGAFWPYSADPGIELFSVTAGRERISVERTALELRELLLANVGAEVIVSEDKGDPYEATIVGFPERSAEELSETSPPNGEESIAQRGNIVLLQTFQGVKVVDIELIRDVTFKNDPEAKVAAEEFRNLLTLDLNWKGVSPDKSAQVGLIYLQRGMRWIPQYMVTLDGEGEASLKLQATLINELTDLEDATVHLVIGVPTFLFKDEVDPMAMGQTLGRLSENFRQERGQFDLLSNSIRTQVAAPLTRASDQTLDLGPEVTGEGGTEDLFVFTLEHVTLAKGERMTIPVTQFELPYEDIYTVDIPYVPPREIRRNLNDQQLRDLAQSIGSLKAMHVVRLENKSDYPLTTAPGLIMSEGRVLAQGLVTYTPVGGKVDLKVTTAVDIAAVKEDNETDREPDAVTFDGHRYMQINLAGSLQLTNHKGEACRIEVTRHVLGAVDSAGDQGRIEQVNFMEDLSFLPDGDQPAWWSWFRWPDWWHRLNGVGRISWEFNLDPGETEELDYAWHYFTY